MWTICEAVNCTIQMIGLLYVCICREKIRFVEVKWHGSLISNWLIYTSAPCMLTVFFFLLEQRLTREILNCWRFNGEPGHQKDGDKDPLQSCWFYLFNLSTQIRQSLATLYSGSKTDWQHILGVRLTASSHTSRKTITWLYRIILFYFIFIPKSSQLFFFLCSLN